MATLVFAFCKSFFANGLVRIVVLALRCLIVAFISDLVCVIDSQLSVDIVFRVGIVDWWALLSS